MGEQGFKKILFPTDFSDASLYAMSYAIGMAKQFKAKLFLLHVVDKTVDMAGFHIPHVSTEKLQEEMKETAEGMLKKLGGKLPRSIKAHEEAVQSGIPHQEIIRFAHDNEIDIIVMGTHGKAGLDRFLFGSTTERVLRQASCPVLTARPPEKILVKGRE